MPVWTAGEQRGQRARQRVDLVRGEHGPVDELGLVLGEHALEPEQQRVLLPPLQRRDLEPGLDVGSAASSARRRAEPGASASWGVSPSKTKRSRVSCSARLIAAELGKGVESPINEHLGR